MFESRRFYSKQFMLDVPQPAETLTLNKKQIHWWFRPSAPIPIVKRIVYEARVPNVGYTRAYVI